MNKPIIMPVAMEVAIIAGINNLSVGPTIDQLSAGNVMPIRAAAPNGFVPLRVALHKRRMAKGKKTHATKPVNCTARTEIIMCGDTSEETL